MNMLEIFSVVLALTSILVWRDLVKSRKQLDRNRKAIRRLERTIEKLDSRNGKLWYRMMQNKAVARSGDFTDVTLTKL